MQNAKQMNSGLKHALEAGIEDFRLPEVRSSPRPNPPNTAGVPSVYTAACWSPDCLHLQPPCLLCQPHTCYLSVTSHCHSVVLQCNQKVNARWTTDEQLLAVQGECRHRRVQVCLTSQTHDRELRSHSSTCRRGGVLQGGIRVDFRVRS